MNAILALLTGVLGFAEVPVREMSIHAEAGRTEVVIATEGMLEVRHFNMEGPYRLVVDLIGAEHALPGLDYPGVNRGGILAVRTSQYSPDVVRIVLELEQPVSYSAVASDGEVRLSLEGTGGGFEAWSTESAAPAGTAEQLPTQLPVAVETAAAATQDAQQEVPRITVTFNETPLVDAIFTIGDLAGRSIIPGLNVSGTVNARIIDRPWIDALRYIVEGQGFVMTQDAEGVITVVQPQTIADRELAEPLETATVTINFATAEEVAQTLDAVKSQERGVISFNASANTVVMRDVPRVITQMRAIIDSLDVQPREVSIQAQLVFIDRTGLEEFGVTYDLKDSQGNQLNQINPGAADQNGDGIIVLPEEQVDVGTDVVSLGGSSIAALGNANSQVINPTIRILSSLVLGRHSLITFVEALETLNVSEIDSRPMIRAVNNSTARIQVGTDVPIRVIDPGTAVAGGEGGAQAPTAQVDVRQTGIILDVTPHVTPEGKILLDLVAENSSVVLQESDAGATFPTQKAETRVLVDSGEQIVIAGLIQEEMSEIRSGIPLLQDLPLVGRLFQVRRQRSATQDLMILVTVSLLPGGPPQN